MQNLDSWWWFRYHQTKQQQQQQQFFIVVSRYCCEFVFGIRHAVFGLVVSQLHTIKIMLEFKTIVSTATSFWRLTANEWLGMAGSPFIKDQLYLGCFNVMLISAYVVKMV